jgi:lipoate-protein ligase A
MMHVETCRLILDPPSSGAWNMAVDEALLHDAIENGLATVRLYQWIEPTLSLGYFQRCADRNQHAASRDAAVVRRQSGGGAILHDRELTYSVALPATHSLAHHAEQLYHAVHEAIIAVLAPHIAAVSNAWMLRMRCSDCDMSAVDEQFLCFQRRARGDVVLTSYGHRSTTDSTPRDWKILGSAQRRRRGAILQHGSLLVEKSPAAPELAGINDLTGRALSAERLATQIPDCLSDTLKMRLQESSLPGNTRVLVTALERRKYGETGWTNRR